MVCIINLVILFSVICAVQSGGSGNGASGNSLSDNTNANGNRGPHFDTAASKNVTALLGKTAYLNCRVKNISNKTVSIVSYILVFLALIPSMSRLSLSPRITW